MVGRKPKPTHLHVAEGTLNVTRHRNRENEPVVTGKPVKPKSLNGRASKIWDDVVEFAHWLTKEIGVAPVPGSSFFASGENRYIRFHFAKRPETLHAAGERLLKLAQYVPRAAAAT